MSDTNQIEKKVILRAPIERVWRAISDASEFGAWFGMEADGPFVAGQVTTGRIAPTQVDPEVARLQAPHAGTPVWLFIEQIDPQRRLQFRWHPYAIDKGKDYSSEPTTLVSFELESVPGGTQLTITESGFENVPLDRRAAAFAANTGGWEHQSRLIARYLLRAA